MARAVDTELKVVSDGGDVGLEVSALLTVDAAEDGRVKVSKSLLVVVEGDQTSAERVLVVVRTVLKATLDGSIIGRGVVLEVVDLAGHGVSAAAADALNKNLIGDIELQKEKDER